MKNYINIGLLTVFLVISLAFVSCYIEPSSSADGTVSIQLNGQDLQSGYTGDILRVSLYLDGDISISETDNPSAYLDEQGDPIETNYTVFSNTSRVPIDGKPYEDFPGPDPGSGPYSGSIQLDGILPGVRYRIVLESFYRYLEEFYVTYATNYAGVSEAFEPVAGQSVSVSVFLQEYYFS
jgi:hypothetical protein